MKYCKYHKRNYINNKPTKSRCVKLNIDFDLDCKNCVDCFFNSNNPEISEINGEL